MKLSKLWFSVTGALAWVAMCLVGQAWGGAYTLHRGEIAHYIRESGNSGRTDNNSKQGNASFRYPQGRNVSVYSGGTMRDGWNARGQTGGEGIWILSNTGGKVHITTGGNNNVTSDVIKGELDPRAWPEAYVGSVYDEEYALTNRRQSGSVGGTAQWRGTTFGGESTNWWPASGGVESKALPITKGGPVAIWNWRFGRYNSNESYKDRIAKGEFPQYTAPAWAENLSEDDFPEAFAIQMNKSSETGLQWTRKWLQWGHTKYNDLYIVENIIENTSDVTQEGVYVNFQNRFSSQASHVWRSSPYAHWHENRDFSNDDHTRNSGADNYLSGVSRDVFISGSGGKPAGMQALKDLADAGHPLMYVHDGESTHTTNLFPDVGDPYSKALSYKRFLTDQAWIADGHIQHGQYFGIGNIDAMPPFNTYGGLDPETYVAPHDNPATPLNEAETQPATISWWNWTNWDDHAQPNPWRDHQAFISDEFVYDALTMHGHQQESDDTYSYSHMVTYGPYTLAPGEKAKVVIFYGGGMGAQDPKYTGNYKRYADTFGVGWMNLYGGTGYAPVSFGDRQKDVPLGEDALARHFQRAIDIYDWGYDIPDAPASIKLSWDSNLSGNNELSWSSLGEESAHPDFTGAEAKDIAGYRIYRSKTENQGPWDFLAEGTIEDMRAGKVSGVTFDAGTAYKTNVTGDYPLGIPLKTNQYKSGLTSDAGAEVPGVYKFGDANSNAGFPYWYSVRYYTKSHAAWSPNNGATTMSVGVTESPGVAGMGAMIGARTGIVPVVPGADVYDTLSKQVRVVPNPWQKGDALHTYKGTQVLRFTNLPGRAKIDLYDVTGQRIWTAYHDNPLRGEWTWNQFSENRPSDFGEAIFSGIYFWKVESMMPGQVGKVQTGTFVIIK